MRCGKAALSSGCKSHPAKSLPPEAARARRRFLEAAAGHFPQSLAPPFLLAGATILPLV